MIATVTAIPDTRAAVRCAPPRRDLGRVRRPASCRRQSQRCRLTFFPSPIVLRVVPRGVPLYPAVAISGPSARSKSRCCAPINGTAQQLALHTVGGVVTPAQQLMVIVPADSQLCPTSIASHYLKSRSHIVRAETIRQGQSYFDGRILFKSAAEATNIRSVGDLSQRQRTIIRSAPAIEQAGAPLRQAQHVLQVRRCRTVRWPRPFLDRSSRSVAGSSSYSAISFFSFLTTTFGIREIASLKNRAAVSRFRPQRPIAASRLLTRRIVRPPSRRRIASGRRTRHRTLRRQTNR